MTMSETYRMFAEFAQTWGLIYFVGVFLIVLAYVYWPSHKRGFDEAARMPLRED
jgi:cytochrome c oxidase cbb3-type subunit 4